MPTLPWLRSRYSKEVNTNPVAMLAAFQAQPTKTAQRHHEQPCMRCGKRIKAGEKYRDARMRKIHETCLVKAQEDGHV